MDKVYASAAKALDGLLFDDMPGNIKSSTTTS